MLLRHKDSGDYEVCLSSAAEEQLYRVRVTPPDGASFATTVTVAAAGEPLAPDQLR